MAYNDAQKRATMKYMAENLEEIRFRVKKGIKDKYQFAADQAGQSLTAYIKQAIEDRIQRDQAAADYQPTQAPETPVKPVQAAEPIQQPQEPQKVTSPALARIQAQEENIWATRDLLLLKSLQNKKITYESMLAKGTLKDWQEEDYQKTLAALAVLEDQQDQ